MARHDQELTNTRVRQTIVTWSLRIFGYFCLVAATVYAGLLVFVPLLNLENPNWERKNNPVTAVNVLLAVATGVGCLYLVRASDRTRFWIGAIVLIIVIAYGIYSELL